MHFIRKQLRAKVQSGKGFVVVSLHLYFVYKIHSLRGSQRFSFVVKSVDKALVQLWVWEVASLLDGGGGTFEAGRVLSVACIVQARQGSRY